MKLLLAICLFMVSLNAGPNTISRVYVGCQKDLPIIYESVNLT
jgi:hypothetical protein